MKKVLIIAALAYGLFGVTVRADEIPVSPTNTHWSVTGLSVGDAQVNEDTGTWLLPVEAVITGFGKDANVSTDDVQIAVRVEIKMSVFVTREELVAEIGVESIDDATMGQVKIAMHTIGLRKVGAILGF